jgi:sorbin and SH3 domain-containing protein 1
MSTLTLPSLVRVKPVLKVVRATRSFQGRSSEELSFSEGALIEVIATDDNKWWSGRCGILTGVFPSSHVVDLEDKSSHGREHIQQNEKAGHKIATALHNFSARTADELSFKKGDLVTISREIDSNFWEASLGGRFGCVPKTYVSKPKAPKPGM